VMSILRLGIGGLCVVLRAVHNPSSFLFHPFFYSLLFRVDEQTQWLYVCLLCHSPPCIFSRLHFLFFTEFFTGIVPFHHFFPSRASPNLSEPPDFPKHTQRWSISLSRPFFPPAFELITGVGQLPPTFSREYRRLASPTSPPLCSPFQVPLFPVSCPFPPPALDFCDF